MTRVNNFTEIVSTVSKFIPGNFFWSKFVWRSRLMTSPLCCWWWWWWLSITAHNLNSGRFFSL